MEVLLYIFGIAAVAFGIWYFLIRKKKELPKPAGQMGIVLPTVSKGFPRPDGGVFYIEENHPFNPNHPKWGVVMEAIDSAAAKSVRIAKLHYPVEKVPPVTEIAVFAIKPMAFTEAGQPALIVTPMGRTNAGDVPIGPPVKTAGTVLNVSQTRSPVIGSGMNPFIVLAYQDEWNDLEYLHNTVWFEAEHVIERWISFEEFLRYSGANDAHPHRPDTTPAAVGFVERTPRAVSCFASADSGELIRLKR